MRTQDQTPDAQPDLSVVIVNWNARQALMECLDSLQRHPPSIPWETIVVDNASSDGSPQEIAARAPRVRLIANTRNLGLARANNQGLLAARGAAMVISNPDVVYQPGSLDALWSAMQRHPRAAFVVPRLLHPDGTLQTSAGDLPRLSEALLGRKAIRDAASRRPETEGFWWDTWAHDEERQIGRGAEACYLVRKAAVEEIGLQDEHFVLDWEGIEWSARAAREGWEIWFCPDAEVVHRGGASILQDPMRWVVRSHRGLYRYFRPQVPMLLRPALAATVAVRAAIKMAALAARQPLYERASRGR